MVVGAANPSKTAEEMKLPLVEHDYGRQMKQFRIVLDKQHQHVFAISVPILASSSIDPIMYIRSLIPYILAPQARQCNLINHLLAFLQQIETEIEY